MSFTKLNEDGTQKRHSQAVIDCSKDDIITEQFHKDEVNINNIVKRHGMDMIAKTAAMQTGVYLMDDIPTNDFAEAMQIISKATESFESLPSEIRNTFNNQPAEYLDFIQNPDNKDALVEMGLAKAPEKITQPEPVEVIIKNTEVTPEKT